ncbi:class I SAM-dependent methyltransferase [Candidatus Woesearchaeota archaeon]|nr:class I SAM-dependent methyltransferase [Candidatus Woesearchaeota archaeon]
MKKGDNIWERYATVYHVIEFSSLYNSLMDKTAECLQSCEKVLDTGCGSGNLLKRLNNSQKLYGIDSNPEMLAIAEKQVPGAILAQQDSSYLKFASNFFMGVACINMLYSADNPEKVLAEAYRVLRPEGILVVSGPKPDIDSAVLEDSFKQDIANLNLNSEQLEEVRIFVSCNKELFGKNMKNLYETRQLEQILQDGIGFREIVHSEDDAYFGQNYFIVAKK